MTYKVLNKAPKVVEGQIVSTIIDIKQDDPYSVLSRELDGDQRETSDNILIEKVLQVVHDETTSKTQLVENVRELKEQSKEQQELIKQQLENNRVLSNAFEELTVVVLDEILPQLAEKDIVEMTPIEPIEPEEAEEPAEDEGED